MKKPLQHDVNTQGEAILVELLSPWIVNPQHKDYGKDFSIEVVDGRHHVTGTSFYVQLKSTKAPRFVKRDPNPVFSLKVQHAKYYLDDVNDLPVFLVLLDIVKRKAWWIFLQQHLRNRKNWRSQKTVAIPIPIENDISNLTKLKKDVEDARAYMRGSHPTVLQDFIETKRSQIRELDSRFAVDVCLENGKSQLMLSPREPVTFRINTLTDHSRRKTKELIEKGCPVEFQPGEIAISGSRIFERLEKEGGVLQMRAESTASIDIKLFDVKAAAIGVLKNIPGRLEGGSKEMTFRGGFQNAPLSISLGPIAFGELIRSRLSFDFVRWEGMPVLNLPWFDKLFQFVSAMQRTHSSSVELSVNGYEAIIPKSPIDDAFQNEWLLQWFELIDMTRKVCRHYRANPIWTVAKFDEDIETIKEIYCLVFEKNISQPCPNAELSFTLTEGGGLPASEKREDNLLMTTGVQYFLLGQSLFTEEIGRQFSNMVLESMSLPDETGNRHVVFRGTQNTMMTVRKVADMIMKKNEITV